MPPDPLTTPRFYATGNGASGFAVPPGATVVQVAGGNGNFAGFWVYPQGTVSGYLVDTP